MDIEKSKTTYIWGAAEYGEYALEYCKDSFNIVGFIDKRADLEFAEFCSKPVISPAQLLCEEKDVVDIIIAVKYPAEVIELLSHSMHGNHIYIFDGRSRENPLLYRVKNGEICVPEYMDKRFCEWKEYSEHYSNLNPFILKMYHTAMKWISKYEKNVEIYEIGCGSGQFANMLLDNGYVKYVGIDFSSRAIELAKKANFRYGEGKFMCEDAFSYLQSYKEKENTLFVMFEVLEHINKDVELLNMLPSGTNIIFSVPNFKSFNHIRTFDDLASIQNRYEMLDILEYLALPANIKADKTYHLVNAVKRKNIGKMYE